LAVTGFRDPCVWREGQDWMLAVGSGVRGQGGAVLLYRSPDLRHWSYLHPLLQGETSSASSLNPVDSGAMWECPDFFPLQGRHVLLISTMGKVWWRVGSYEQQRFQVEKSGITDYGAYYAARTMLDRDGNRVLWGWIPERRPESEYRAAGWAGVMSLPRVLSLDGDGRLRMEPAPPLQRLRERHMSIALGEEQSKVQTALGRLRIANLAAEIALEFTGPFQLRLLAAGDKPFAELEYRPDRRGSELRLNHASAALPVQNDHGALRLFLDGSVLELFVNKNTVITDRVYSAPNADLRVSVRGAAVKLDLWQMKPISHDRLTA
jgi:beta-fructofuranosidase